MSVRAARIVLLLVILAGAAIRLEMWRASHIADDDALITFRYAANLAHGQGFIYNPGERVLGTTTPLFTLLLAGGAAAGLPIPAWAFALNMLSYVAGGLLLYFLLESVGLPWAGVLAALLHAASLAGLMMSEIGGMETPFYVALVLLAFVLYARGRTGGAAAAAGLALMTRPDGALLALALALAYVAERRRLPLREIGIFALVAAPWVLFAWAYFGSPIPNSVLAKRVFFHDHWPRTPMEIFQTFHTGRTSLVLNLLALVGAVFAWVRQRRLTPVTLWLVLYLAFFMAGRVVIHYWYLPPFFTPLFALAALGLFGVLEFVAGLAGRPGTAPRTAALAALLVLAAGAIGARGRAVLAFARRDMVAGQRMLDHTHRALGEWIDAHTARDARIYVGDIGYVGYYSGRRILDPVGLVSPEAIRWNRMRQPVGLIREQRPDACIVAFYGIDYATILEDPWFRAHYRMAARVQDSELPSIRLADFDPARRTRYVPDYGVFVADSSVAN